MPLCPNTYRRGSIYWWRRRFADPATKRRQTLAFSLKVRDPRAARILGSRLNAEAGQLAQRMELGTMSFGMANNVLAAFVAGQAALEQQAFARAVQGVATYDAAQERAMLIAMGRDIEERLTREAIHNRAHGGNDPRDAVDAKAMTVERAFGFIYKHLATYGHRARFIEADQTAIAARGLSPELVGFVERETAYHANNEWSDSWTLGPTREYFVRFLQEADVAAVDVNVAALRRSYLALHAELLLDAEPRYRSARSPVEEACDILRGRGSSVGIQETTGPEVSSPPPFIGRPGHSLHPSADMAQQPIQAPAQASAPVAPGSLQSFTGHIATLAKRKIKLKKDGQPDGWEEKTANQHLSIARLFVKLAGTDNPACLNQKNVGAYRDLLDFLPKAWGKSTKDTFLSLDEILARCEDLDDDEIGLAAGTVNRHMTQLGNCLAHLAGHGAVIGEITRGLRTKGVGRERATFTVEDEATLFSSPTWSCQNVVHGSDYFVPFLAKYEVMRLSEITGLEPKDINLDKGYIHVRPNRIRPLKNTASIRRLPIMPEVERVGFCEYAEEILSLGCDVFWPDIPLRGTKTPMQNLYYKSWSIILAAALPNAGAEHKSMHSWRKAGNSAMAGANINDPLRYQILGHAYRDVNGRHYTDELSLADKRAAMSEIPVTTGHVIKHPLTLHPGIARK